MSLLDGAAALSVYSETRSAAEVTARTGLQPDSTHEIGDARKNRDLYTFSYWDLTVRDDEAAATAPDDDTAGFASLKMLLQRLAPHTDALKSLRPEYHLVLSWHGTSGSYQGGFVLPVEIMRALVELDCSLYGNVYAR